MPVDATNKTVIWTITNGATLASINSAGLVTALGNGTVTVAAGAGDGSGIYGVFVITISNQSQSVTGINITGAGDSTSITTDGGSLQLIDQVLPEDATQKTVTWSISSGMEYATINATGLVTAVDNGIVTAMATATDGSGVFATIDISITGQVVPVSGITIYGVGSTRTITVTDGTLQLKADVFPANATDKSVTWSIAKGNGLATVNTDGLVTAIENGIITVVASADDGSGITGSIDIPIAINDNEVVPVNVTKNEMRINLNSNFLSWRADLYNFQGGLVMSTLIESDTVIFNISSLPSGVYLVVLSKGANLRVTKVMKP